MSRTAIVNRVSRIAFPILLSSLVSLFAPLINAAIIGWDQPASLFILAIWLPLIFLQVAVNESLRVSSIAFSSQAAGSQDLVTLNRRLHGLIALGVAINLGIALAFLAGHRLFLNTYSVPVGQRSTAFGFIQLSLLTGVLLLVSMAMMSTLYGYGQIRSVTVVTIISLVANVAINFTLVTGAGLGLYALPLSTAVTAGTTIAWAARRLTALGILRLPDRAALGSVVRTWREIARISVPVSASYLVSFINGLLFTHVLALFSPDALAGFGVAYRIQNLVTMPAIAIGIGLAITVNRMVAAREPEHVQSFMSTTLVATFTLFACLSVIVFSLRSVLTELITGDTAIAAAASQYLGYMAPAYAIFGPLLMMILFLQETGNGFRALAFNITLVTVQLGLAFYLARTHHSVGDVYRGLAASYLVAVVFILHELARTRRLGGRISMIKTA